ncbi:MAG: polyketide cyclase [Polaromonas sp.]|nr:polyketide cyclase [Polaromonas sp.]
MTHVKPLLAATALLGALINPALADDKAVVQKFYDFLSNPASAEHAGALKAVMADNFVSIGDHSGKNKSREAFIGQVGGFGKLIPDLKWAPQEVIVAEGGKVIVRSRATGTPRGPLFGVDGKGKGFDIMSIDIHTVVDGKIVQTHHVEDWSGALRQLSAP